VCNVAWTTIIKLFVDGIERNSVYSRVDIVAQRHCLAAFPWATQKETCYCEYAKSLPVVDYDLPAQTPQKGVAPDL
jgi:sulfotransferase